MGSTINFEVRGETNAYIDLKSTKLCATIQIVDSKGTPIATDTSDGIVNQILHIGPYPSRYHYKIIRTLLCIQGHHR